MTVYINGIGVLTSLGIGLEELQAGIASGESGLHSDNPFGRECGHIAGDIDLSTFTETTYHYIDPATAFTLAVLCMARDDSGDVDADPYQTGLIVGTEWGASSTMEMFQAKLLEKHPRFAPPFLFSNSFPNSPTAIASIEFGIKGYSTVFAGCANAGFMAVLNACRVLESGRADTVSAVGVDALSQAVLDAHVPETALSDGAAALQMGAGPSDSAVAVRACALGTAPDGGGPDFSVSDGIIYDPDGKPLKIGSTMAAAFPLAAGLAAIAVRSGQLPECRARYEDEGYIDLIGS